MEGAQRLSVPALNISFDSPAAMHATGPTDNGEGNWSFETRPDKAVLITTSIEYGKELDGVHDWTIAQESVHAFAANPTCDAFTEDYIPVNVRRTAVCETVQTKDGHDALTMVGLGYPFEGWDYLESMILVPLEDRAILLFYFDAFAESDQKLEAFVKDYIDAHPEKQFGWMEPDYDELSKAVTEELETYLTPPSADVLATRSMLKDVAQSIEVSE